MNQFDGPGPGEPISRRDLRELAQGVNDQTDVYGGIGINRDDTMGPRVDSVPMPQRCNARIIDGENPYSWEEVQQAIGSDGTASWLTTGVRGGTQDLIALYERGDESDVPSGTIVEAQLDEATGNWLFTKPPVPELKKAQLLRRKGTDYSWKYDGDSHPTGVLAIDTTFTTTQTADNVYPFIYVLKFFHDDTFAGGVTGSFTLTEAGGSPATVTVADVIALLTGGTLPLSTFTYVFTPITGGPSYITFTSTSADPTKTLAFDGSGLGPTTAKSPANFREDSPMAVPAKVYVRLDSGAKPSVRVTTKQSADGSAKRAIYILALKNATSGQYRFWFDGTGGGSEGAGTNGWVRLNWDDNAAAIQTTLSTLLGCTVSEIDSGVFQVTVTADYHNHSPQVDPTGGLFLAERLGGTQKFGAVWSNGNSCTSPAGGRDLTTITGYVGPAAAPTLSSVTINGGDVSNPASWTITLTGSGLGVAQKFSFGTDTNPATAHEVDVASDGTPSLHIVGGEPWTITGVSGVAGSLTFTVTMNANGAHTLDLYPGGLRPGVIPDQIPFLHGGSGCIRLMKISDIPDPD